jgi:hypothetical protein
MSVLDTAAYASNDPYKWMLTEGPNARWLTAVSRVWERCVGASAPCDRHSFPGRRSVAAKLRPNEVAAYGHEAIVAAPNRAGQGPTSTRMADQMPTPRSARVPTRDHRR